ncbi:camp-dependent protein kinase regulatory subunit [Zychaea mexicana]|uniref:camp-dependent protein kinase regulatory subunit n=1 Tax=Zychaea mexicana TaxID=64656 RepID=UPI0022FEEF73|nr:camp-dependent protein kinase regulatory subunit [Zychaea mexicana]KAI9493234.1 camp-dependent protein kinase regulatory subunit [Zychaea mexicana]
MTIDSNFSFGAESNEYNDLLAELHAHYCQAGGPQDVLQFCANFFNHKLEEQRAAFRQEKLPFAPGLNEHQHPFHQDPHQQQQQQQPQVVTYTYSDDEEDDDEEYDEDEQMDTLGSPISFEPAAYNRDRRVSVSAESMTPSSGSDYPKKVIPKSAEQCERIKVSVANNFLFRNLDEEQYQDVVHAMAEKRVQQDEKVIEQGAVGDYFYVVESGTFDCYIAKDNQQGAPVKVTSYEAGGSFGELALMYNAPRAATIIATSDAVLWALDRITFRTILMENTSRKRRLYESFLREVPLLKSLEPYERHKVADALESVYFNDGEEVVVQGDIGDRFYMIEAGDAVVYKDGTEVNRLGRAAYFGELALLNDSPRAATVVAQGRLKCATLGKKAFTRLLGPVLDILKRNSENYHAIINSQHQAS